MILAYPRVAAPFFQYLVPETMDTVQGLGEAEADVLAVESEYEDFVQGNSARGGVNFDGEPTSLDDEALSDVMKSLDDFHSLRAICGLRHLGCWSYSG